MGRASKNPERADISSEMAVSPGFLRDRIGFANGARVQEGPGGTAHRGLTWAAPEAQRKWLRASAAG